MQEDNNSVELTVAKAMFQHEIAKYTEKGREAMNAGQSDWMEETFTSLGIAQGLTMALDLIFKGIPLAEGADKFRRGGAR